MPVALGVLLLQLERPSIERRLQLLDGDPRGEPSKSVEGATLALLESAGHRRVNHGCRSDGHEVAGLKANHGPSVAAGRDSDDCHRVAV